MKTMKHWVLSNDLIFVLRLSRICCLAPIHSCVQNRTRLVYISRVLQIISFIVAAIPQLFVMYKIYLIIATGNKEDYKRNIIGSLQISFIVAFVSYAVFNNETRIKTYITCHTKINKVKRNLYYYGKNVRNFRVIMLMISFICGTYLLMIIDDFVYFKTLRYRKLVFMIELTFSNVLQLQFLYIALSINTALNIIKTGLKEELSKMIDDDVDKTRRQKLANRISLLNDSYVLICDVLREFNSSHNVILFLQLVAFTFSIVSVCYKMVSLNQDEPLMVVKLIIQFMWFIFQIINIIIIIEPYHLAQHKIKRIRLIVAQMMCYITSERDPVIHEIKAFSKQLLLKDTTYSALGLCDLGRPIISGIMGVITTLVIIILDC